METRRAITCYTNILIRLFNDAHHPNTSLSYYNKKAKHMNDILYIIRHDHGYHILMEIMYRVAVATGFSFGPIDPTLMHDMVLCGCIITKIYTPPSYLQHQDVKKEVLKVLDLI